MLAGLLQDIGVLALAQSHPDTYLPLLRDAHSNAALLDAERAQLQCTHAEVGAYMAAQWDLPRYLTEAIARSEDSAPSQDTFQACVQLSGTVADIWLDDASLQRAAKRQTETHKAFIRSRWMAAWIDAVEYGKFGRATVTATLFGGMDASLIARMKELEAENARLKKMYIETQIKNDLLSEALGKKP